MIADYRGRREALLVAILVCAIACSTPSAIPALAQSAAPTPSASQLDTLVAPVALYPDPLLASVLAASTYPIQVVEAARDVANGATPTSAEMSQWDPSVQSLTGYPSVLTMMSNQLDWTTQLGQAVSQSQSAVMAAVQRVRAQAQAAGNLQSNDKQTVTSQSSTIIIEPANPQVIYVPQYNPVAILSPAPAYAVAPAGYGLMTFGVGFAAGALTAYGCNWGSSSINVNNSYNYNYNKQTNYSNFTNTHNQFSNWKPPSNVGSASGNAPLGTGHTYGMPSGTQPLAHHPASGAQPVAHNTSAGAGDVPHDNFSNGGDRAGGGGLFGGAGGDGWASRAASDRGAQSLGSGGFDRSFGGFGGARRR